MNPAFQKEIASSISTCSNPTACANLKLMANTSSAFWIDVKAKINGDAADTVSVSGILADAASRTPVPTVLFIVYECVAVFFPPACAAARTLPRPAGPSPSP